MRGEDDRKWLSVSYELSNLAQNTYGCSYRELEWVIVSYSVISFDK